MIPTLQSSTLGEELVRVMKNSPITFDPLAPRIDAGKPGGSSTGAPSVPTWLYNIIREEIGDPTQALVCPLVGPSGIRAKYLSALQEHVTADKCTLCEGRNISWSWNVG